MLPQLATAVNSALHVHCSTAERLFGLVAQMGDEPAAPPEAPKRTTADGLKRRKSLKPAGIAAAASVINASKQKKAKPDPDAAVVKLQPSWWSLMGRLASPATLAGLLGMAAWTRRQKRRHRRFYRRVHA